MKRKSRFLYREMLMRIGSQLEPGYSEKQWIEQSFHASYVGLFRLLQAAKDYIFADEQERIWFFKTQQPRFAAWMEYFAMLYTAQLFLPKGVREAMDYWEGELRRTQNFLIKHAAFHERYHQKGTEYDADFSSPGSSSGCLAARIIAREKYLEYVQQRLTQLLSCHS